MEGVTLGRDALIEKFGISQRLAVRIGALLAKQVQVTAAVLEGARPGSAMEALLLHPRVLTEAESLNSEMLGTLAGEVGVTETLSVQRTEGRAVIALVEEVLAEQSWRATTPPGEKLARLPEKPDLPTDLLRPSEVKMLFLPQEIARLKLEALTSADEHQRIAAIRRLCFAPISNQEKGSLLLQVLLDPVPPVRREAIRELEALGFNHAMAEALEDVFGPDEAHRTAALGRIGALFAHLRSAEKMVVLTVLAAGLREFSAAATQAHLLQVLSEAVPMIAENPTLIEGLVSTCTHHLLLAPQELEHTTRDFLSRLAVVAPDETARQLTRQLETMRDRHVRAFLLLLLAQIALHAGAAVPGSAEKVADLMVQELTAAESLEFDEQRLGHNLVALGRAAAAPMLAAFCSGDNRVRALLAPFLDELVTRVPETLTQVAELFLTCLRSGDRRLRMQILRTRAPLRKELPPLLRQRIAEALVQEMTAYTHPHLIEEVDRFLEELGADAVQPLAGVIRDDAYSQVADRAVRILARILQQPEERSRLDPALINALLKQVRRLAADARVRGGGYFWALGVICAAPGTDPHDSEEAALWLQSCVTRVPCSADVLAALGYLGASANVSLDRRIAIARLCSEILEPPGEAPEDILRERESPEGKVYESGVRADFDSVALPAAIDALRRICLAPCTTEALRNQLGERLAELWEKVASWTLVWGPRSTDELADALGAIGASPDTPPALVLRIARGLSLHISRLSAVRALGTLAANPSEEQEFNLALCEAGRRVAKQWTKGTLTLEERQLVLGTLTTIAARAQLPRHSPRTHRLRREVVELLFAALREEQYWTRELLERLCNTPGISQPLQKRIRERLAEVFALARIPNP